MRIPLCLLVLPALAAALPAQAWAMITPTTTPSQRRAGAMAWDPGTNRLILYGGVSATPSIALNQTWAYNGQWTQLMTPSAATRWGHRMVLNTATNRIVTFGGRSPTISALANDTVQWQNNQWTPIATTNAPAARFLYGMCYDQVRSVIVLFGGRTLQGVRNDTWEFDGVNWTERTTATSPPAREEMVMHFDASLNRTILFGGCDEANSLIYGDTWFYDGNGWQEVTPTNSPSARFRAGSVFDSVRQRIVLFGGYDGTQILADTYEFTGSTWNQLSVAGAQPPNGTEAYTGYDPMRRKFVLFGGFGGTFINETWEFTGSTAGAFGTFGTGCPTPLGVPGISATTPTLGQTLTITFDNLPLTVAGMVTALGLSNTSFNGLPLPLDLAILGLPGCDLLVSADLIDIVVAAGGTAQLAFAVPNQPALLNRSLYVQGLVLNLVPTFQFVGASAGGRAILGQ